MITNEYKVIISRVYFFQCLQVTAAGGKGSRVVLLNSKQSAVMQIKYRMKNFLAYSSPAIYAINKARHERDQRQAPTTPTAPIFKQPSAVNNPKSGKKVRGEK